MQLTETHADALSRVFRVVVPRADLQKALDAKIEEVRPKVRLNGFRPGKVPAAHLRKLYGLSMLREIIDSEVDTATKQALGDGKLRMASQPDLKVESDMEKVIALQEDLSFLLNIELIPDFEPVDPATLSVEKIVAPVSDEQLEAALDQLVKSQRVFEEKDGAAAEGDAVVIDFVGKIDDEPFEGGAGEKATVVIGAKQFIPGFEEGMIGLSKGDTKAVPATFPDTYGAEHLQGKQAVFDVTVHEVRAPKELVADDSFAERLGMENIQAVKDALKGRIEAEHTAQTRLLAKRALFDQIDAAHSFPLPPQMVEQEFGSIWRQIETDRTAGRLDEEDAGKSEEELRAEYRKIAERRVRLGLVLAEIGRRASIDVSNDEVSQEIMNQARQFPGQERQVFEVYQKNPQLVAQIRAPIFEEKTVDYVLELAKVTTRTVDRETLFAEQVS